MLWLIRHGESTWNALGLAQGHDDGAELTDRGRRQAEEVAERFAGRAVRAIYSSDLRRARQTAAPLEAAVGVPAVLDARLRERSLGVLEGTPAADNGPSDTGLDLAAGLLADPDIRPEGGESVRDLYRRAAAFLDEVWAGTLSAGPQQAGGDIVVVAHGGTLRVLRAYLSGVPVERMDWPPLGNTAILEFPGFRVPAPQGTTPQGTTPQGTTPHGTTPQGAS